MTPWQDRHPNFKKRYGGMGGLGHNNGWLWYRWSSTSRCLELEREGLLPSEVLVGEVTVLSGLEVLGLFFR